MFSTIEQRLRASPQTGTSLAVSLEGQHCPHVGLSRTTPYVGRASLCLRDALVGRTKSAASATATRNPHPPTPNLTPPKEELAIGFQREARAISQRVNGSARGRWRGAAPWLGPAGHMLHWSLREQAAGELLSVTGDSSDLLTLGTSAPACPTRARRTR